MELFWLGQERGYLADWTTQRWVQATGRTVRYSEAGWIEGLTGATRGIGPEYYEALAKELGLELREAETAPGLLERFEVLDGPHFDSTRVDPAIVRFYEQTAHYQLDSWSEWRGPFRPFGTLLARLFSRRLRQLNIPLSPLDSSRGLSSRIVHLQDPAAGTLRHTGWIRELRATGSVLFVGDYGVCRPPGYPEPCLKVVFPLPNGSATVILRPEVREDGSLLLHSHGERWGDPGFYFVVRRDPGSAWVRYVRTLRETIHVYREQDGLRTDHSFWIWGFRYLHLHYRLMRLPDQLLLGSRLGSNGGSASASTLSGATGPSPTLQQPK